MSKFNQPIASRDTLITRFKIKHLTLYLKNTKLKLFFVVKNKKYFLNLIFEKKERYFYKNIRNGKLICKNFQHYTFYNT